MRFAKVASNLHTNPKVFAAGRNGREIYLWALCKNAELEADGTVPARYFEPAFASRMLDCDAGDVTDGIARAESSGLIRRTPGGDVVLVGWDEDWRPPSDGKERTRRWREGKKAESQPASPTTVTFGDAGDNTESHGDGSDVREERREEKKERAPRRSSPSPKVSLPSAWHPPPDAAEIAAAEGKTLAREVRNFRDYALREGKVYADWNAAFRGWLRRHFPSDEAAKPKRSGRDPAMAAFDAAIAARSTS